MGAPTATRWRAACHRLALRAAAAGLARLTLSALLGFNAWRALDTLPSAAAIVSALLLATLSAAAACWALPPLDIARRWARLA